MTISKQAVGGGEELTGAVLKLTAPAGTDLSKVKGSTATAALLESKPAATPLHGRTTPRAVHTGNLPAGVYTLEETTAPDGFTKRLRR
ncbi:MAG: prealbumin-like fold domain-containing protein [Ruminococcus sp.]